jgi:hypothetical protein
VSHKSSYDGPARHFTAEPWSFTRCRPGRSDPASQPRQWIAYLYLRHEENQRRLEIIHAERLAAMDKASRCPGCGSIRRRFGKAGVGWLKIIVLGRIAGAC